MTDRPRKIAPASRTGFTLVEMLVVIAIIVLAMTLAIPAIRSLTGSRSIDAAENTVTSYIAMTRAEAIGLQRVEGVLFFIDTSTDRVNCIAVKESPQQASDTSGVLYLDLVDNRDPVALPTGTRLWTIKDSVPLTMTQFTEPLPKSRFLGYNWYAATMNDPAIVPKPTCIPGGVILFDGHSGQLTSRPYGFRFSANGSNTAPPSPLGRLCYAMSIIDDTQLKIPDWPTEGSPTATAPVMFSQVGLVLFDRETFATQPFIVAGAADQNDITGGATEVSIDGWIDTNTTPVFVNRYDGTLMRAE